MNKKTSLIELAERVEASLNSIRPYLVADGGDVKVLGVSAGMIARLEFLGACGNCPMSTMTFKAGVEEAIRKAVPEIKSIEIVNLTVA
jgi:Fe-S cluster biogenesis protein NfuA